MYAHTSCTTYYQTLTHTEKDEARDKGKQRYLTWHKIRKRQTSKRELFGRVQGGKASQSPSSESESRDGKESPPPPQNSSQPNPSAAWEAGKDPQPFTVRLI